MLTTTAVYLAGVEELAGRVTISVEEAAAILGIGRSAAYEAARRGQLPTRRLGRRLFVPVPAFLHWLGALQPSPADGLVDQQGATVT